MSYSWQTGNNSWNDVISKAFDRCDGYVKKSPKNYPKSTICILYYKGTTPSTDKEKIKTAQNYYSEDIANRFFNEYPYVLNDKNNLVTKKKLLN